MSDSDHAPLQTQQYVYRQSMIGLYLIAMCLLLPACASMPFGTMWKLSRMEPQDLVQTNPSAVRVAIRTEDLFLDQAPAIVGNLEIELTGSDEYDTNASIKLSEVTNDGYYKLPKASQGESWRVLALREDQIEEFQQLQLKLGRYLANKSDATPKHMLKVKVNFKHDSDTTKESQQETPTTRAMDKALERWSKQGLRISTMIRLHAEDDFLMLFLNARIPFETNALPAPASEDLEELETAYPNSSSLWQKKGMGVPRWLPSKALAQASR